MRSVILKQAVAKAKRTMPEPKTLEQAARRERRYRQFVTRHEDRQRRKEKTTYADSRRAAVADLEMQRMREMQRSFAVRQDPEGFRRRADKIRTVLRPKKPRGEAKPKAEPTPKPRAKVSDWAGLGAQGSMDLIRRHGQEKLQSALGTLKAEELARIARGFRVSPTGRKSILVDRIMAAAASASGVDLKAKPPLAVRNDKNNDGYTDGAKPKGAPRKRAAPKTTAAPSQPSNFRIDASRKDEPQTQSQRIMGGRSRDPNPRRAAAQNKDLDRANAQTASMLARMADPAQANKPWKSEWYRGTNPPGGRSSNTSSGGVHDGFSAETDATWRRAANLAREGDKEAFYALREKTKPGSRERMMLERGWATTRANQRDAKWVAEMKRRGAIKKFYRAMSVAFAR